MNIDVVALKAALKKQAAVRRASARDLQNFKVGNMPGELFTAAEVLEGIADAIDEVAGQDPRFKRPEKLPEVTRPS